MWLTGESHDFYNLSMSNPILATKLYIPPTRPNIVPRPRLVEQLTQGLHLGHKLTLISAPAGFGKTTLAAYWLASRERPVAWLSLDAGDSDLNVFLTYLTGAVRIVYPAACASTISLLQSSQMPSMDYLANILSNELIELPGRLVLALDLQ